MFRTLFTAAGYTVVCSGADVGERERVSRHRTSRYNLLWQGWIRAVSWCSASAPD